MASCLQCKFPVTFKACSHFTFALAFSAFSFVSPLIQCKHDKKLTLTLIVKRPLRTNKTLILLLTLTSFCFFSSSAVLCAEQKTGVTTVSRDFFRSSAFLRALKRQGHKKVLLRERKRHTDRGVSSTPSDTRGGVPPPPGQGYPPARSNGGGTRGGVPLHSCTWPGYPPWLDLAGVPPPCRCGLTNKVKL